MKHITTYEVAGKVLIKENCSQCLTEKEARDLEKYIGSSKLDKKCIKWGRNSVTFINYVGFIQLTTVSIEILPKTQINSSDKEIEESRKMLLQMLYRTGSLKINVNNMSMNQMCKHNLLEMFGELFALMLEKELMKGLYMQYVQLEENLSVVKGNILFHKQLQNQATRVNRVHCQYEEFSAETQLNYILKSAIEKLMSNVKQLGTLKKLKRCSVYFDELAFSTITSMDFNTVYFNRLNRRFEPIFILARMILENMFSLSSFGKEKSFSILFRMDELFEKYIANLLDTCIEHKVMGQHKKYKLMINEFNDREVYPLKPDIVVLQNDSEKLIIDTKWKFINGSRNRHGVKREDLFQMYAYLTRYEKVSTVILLYPHQSAIAKPSSEVLESWYLEESTGIQQKQKIRVYSVNLSSERRVIQDLQGIIEENLTVLL
ncbi:MULTISPECIES: McrC family protein [unclassified Bacillus (in: firmicutes)]|uniref:McrC family protein n=1 Tax=unclassified Bacillus (in: firmicutes) TaxID=185979 RepID=UPI00364C4A0C